ALQLRWQWPRQSARALSGSSISNFRPLPLLLRANGESQGMRIIFRPKSILALIPEGDSVSLRENFLGVKRNGQTFRLDHGIIDYFSTWRVSKQSSRERGLSAGIQMIHRDQQPLLFE